MSCLATLGRSLRTGHRKELRVSGQALHQPGARATHHTHPCSWSRWPEPRGPSSLSALPLPGLSGGMWWALHLHCWERLPGSVIQCGGKQINPPKWFLFFFQQRNEACNPPETARGQPSLDSFPALVTVIKLVIWVQGIKVRPVGLRLTWLTLWLKHGRGCREALLPTGFFLLGTWSTQKCSPGVQYTE